MFGVTGLHFHQIESDKINRTNKWSVKLTYSFWVFNWISGHILGGMVFLGLIGWLGSFLSFTLKVYFILGLGILSFVATLLQFKFINLPMPQLTRQVSRSWLPNLNKFFVAFGYGFQLGTGVLTRIKVATTYLVIGCAFCSGSIILGGIIGGLFGFSRSILPIILASQNTSPNKSLGFSVKFNSYDGRVQKINGAALLISGCILCFSVFFSELIK